MIDAQLLRELNEAGGGEWYCYDEGEACCVACEFEDGRVWSKVYPDLEAGLRALLAYAKQDEDGKRGE